MRRRFSLPLAALGLGLAAAGCAGALEDARPVVTVLDVQDGDRSCYLVVREASGARATHHARFDLCDDGLVGQRVRLTLTPAEIASAACEGEPDCDRTERVLLVTRVEPAGD